jgi:ribosomal protein S18 acetylase RimI-like enzyme
VSGDAVGDMVAAPGGRVRLRPQTAADAPFLFALFHGRMAAMLAPAGLAPEALDSLIASQYRLRGLDYRAKFPRARWSVVEAEDGPIGELIEHDEPDAVYIVDMTLRPARQAQGIGGALVRALMTAHAARGGVRAIALASNEHSLRMFRKLGFAAAREDGDAYYSLRWRPPAASA